MDPDDINEDETVYYNGEAHTVIRGYNGLNVQIENEETGEGRIVDPNALDEEPPEDEPEEDEESTEDEEEEEVDPAETPATALNGLGPDMAADLAEDGIETVQDVADAGVGGLTDSGISEGWAENFVEEAEDLVG